MNRTPYYTHVYRPPGHESSAYPPSAAAAAASRLGTYSLPGSAFHAAWPTGLPYQVRPTAPGAVPARPEPERPGAPPPRLHRADPLSAAAAAADQYALEHRRYKQQLQQHQQQQAQQKAQQLQQPQQQQLQQKQAQQLQQEQRQQQLKLQQQQQHDRLQQERLQHDRLQQDRLQQERLHQERLEQERQQQERLQQAAEQERRARRPTLLPSGHGQGPAEERTSLHPAYRRSYGDRELTVGGVTVSSRPPSVTPSPRPSGDPRLPLHIVTAAEASQRESPYNPQTEAISPTLPADGLDESPLRSTKDELLGKIGTIDREIMKAESQIAKLKRKQGELEQQAARPDGSAEEEEDREPKMTSLPQTVYAENRKRARAAKAMFEKLKPPQPAAVTDTAEQWRQHAPHPLYNQPSDCAAYAATRAAFAAFKPRLVSALRRRRLAQSRREREQGDSYGGRLRLWLRRLEQHEMGPKHRQCAARDREFYEKVFPEIRRMREERERPEEPADADQQKLAERRRLLSLAVVPPPLLDARRRQQRFIARGGLITEPLKLHDDLSNHSVWSEAERLTLSERYLQHPKQFHLVAAGLERHSTRECVRHYYLSKKQVKYKERLKKARSRGRTRGPARPPPAPLVLGADLPGITTRGALQQRGRTGATAAAPPDSAAPPAPDSEPAPDSGPAAGGEERTEEEPPKEPGRPGCAVCQTEAEQWRPLPPAHAPLYGLSESGLPEDARVCTACVGRSARRRHPQVKCPVPTCPTPLQRVRRLRPLPARWADADVALRRTIAAEMRLTPEVVKCCSACRARLSRRLCGRPERPAEPAWSHTELERLRTALRRHGADWRAAAAAVGSRTPAQCRRLYCRREPELGLQTALAHHRQAVAPQLAADVVTDTDTETESSGAEEERQPTPPAADRPATVAAGAEAREVPRRSTPGLQNHTDQRPLESQPPPSRPGSEKPRPAPEQFQPAPEQPRPLAPGQFQQAPEQPRPAPEQPRLTPGQFQPAPEQPRLTPGQFQPAPEEPRLAPEQPRLVPEQLRRAREHFQPGSQQPRPAPEQLRPAPGQPRPAPGQPRPAPGQSRPALVRPRQLVRPAPARQPACPVSPPAVTNLGPRPSIGDLIDVTINRSFRSVMAWMEREANSPGASDFTLNSLLTASERERPSAEPDGLPQDLSVRRPAAAPPHLKPPPDAYHAERRAAVPPAMTDPRGSLPPHPAGGRSWPAPPRPAAGQPQPAAGCPPRPTPRAGPGSISQGTPLAPPPREGGSITQGTPRQLESRRRDQPSPAGYRYPLAELASRHVLITDYITSQQMQDRRDSRSSEGGDPAGYGRQPPPRSTPPASPRRQPPAAPPPGQQRAGVIQRPPSRPGPSRPPAEPYQRVAAAPYPQDNLSTLVDVAVAQGSLMVPARLERERQEQRLRQQAAASQQRQALQQRQQQEQRLLQHHQQQQVQQRHNSAAASKEMLSQAARADRSLDKAGLTAMGLIDTIINRSMTQESRGAPAAGSEPRYQGRDSPRGSYPAGPPPPPDSYGYRYRPAESAAERAALERARLARDQERHVMRVAQAGSPGVVGQRPPPGAGSVRLSAPHQAWLYQQQQLQQRPAAAPGASPFDYVKNKIAEVMRTSDKAGADGQEPAPLCLTRGSTPTDGSAL